MPSRSAARRTSATRRTVRPRPATAAAGSERAGGDQLPPEADLDPPREPGAGSAPGRPNPPASSVVVSPRGSSKQRQRVALGLGHDHVPDRASSGPPSAESSSALGLVVRQALDLQVRQSGQRVTRLAGREHQADRVGGQPPAAKPRACADAWSSHGASSITQISGRLPGHVAEQAEHGQPDQEPVRRRPGADAERDPQRVALRRRQVSEVIQHRRAQPMEPGESQRHLGLHARRARHPASGGRGPRGQAVQQRASCPRPGRRGPTRARLSPARTASMSRSRAAHSLDRPVRSAAGTDHPGPPRAR